MKRLAVIACLLSVASAVVLAQQQPVAATTRRTTIAENVAAGLLCGSSEPPATTKDKQNNARQHGTDTFCGPVLAPLYPAVADTGKIPTASQFADPNVKISGLSAPQPLSAAKPGDTIAQAHGSGANGNAEGHVGIVIALPGANSPGQTASANANQGGKVAVNNWGFRNPNANPNNGERNGASSPPPVVRHPLATPR